MKNLKVRVMSETGLSVALAVVLSFIRIYQMPQGGSVSLEMVPIIWLAISRGPVVGITGGILYGLIRLLLGAFIVHPLQFIMDYPLAYGLLGLAGFVSAALRRTPDAIRRVYLTGAAVIIAGLLRFAAHYLSGIIYFGQYAPEGQPVWIYSLIYNITYILPEMIIAFIALLFIVKSGVLLESTTGQDRAQ